MQSLNMEEQEKKFAGIISKIVIDNIELLDSEKLIILIKKDLMIYVF